MMLYAQQKNPHWKDEETHHLIEVVLAVATILDVVNFQDFFLTQEAGHLGTGIHAIRRRIAAITHSQMSYFRNGQTAVQDTQGRS